MMRLDWLSGLVKSKSHPTVTAEARREGRSRYRDDPVRVGVIVPVEFVMDHIVDTGGRYLISRLEFIAFFFHVLLPGSPNVGSWIYCLADDYR